MNNTNFLFDIGNVLLDFSFTPLQQEIANSSQATLAQVQAEWQAPAHFEVETGKINATDYFALFSQRLGLTWTYEQWIDQWSQIFTPNPDLHGLYLDLLQQGHTVAMLSNLAPHHVTAIERGSPGFFDTATHLFFSFELGLHKPDPAIYRAVAQRLNCTPQQCVFLDDMQVNVEGALSIGMRAIQVTPENHAEVEDFVRSLLV